MRRIAVLTGVLSGLLLQPMTVAADGPDDGGRGRGRDGTVWVVNRDRDEVAISSRVDKAYITNETAGTISVLSTRTLDSSPEIVLGPRPHHIEASRDGAEIVVGLVGTNAVAVIDGRTDQVSARYTSSTNQAATAHGPYLRGDTIYVAHESGGDVTAIDTKTESHRDHRRRDPPAERGAARPAPAALRVRSG